MPCARREPKYAVARQARPYPELRTLNHRRNAAAAGQKARRAPAAEAESRIPGDPAIFMKIEPVGLERTKWHGGNKRKISVLVIGREAKGRAKEMLKTLIDPAMSMKTKGDKTQ